LVAGSVRATLAPIHWPSGSVANGVTPSTPAIGAKTVIDAATDLVLEAARALRLDDPTTPFGIADYGCADGGTSIDLHRALIADIRKREVERPIALYYTDLPGNDYSSLFKRLQGLLPMDTVGFTNFEKVYPFASGTTFYRQIVPASTLALGFSATAMHWMSHRPRAITGHVHSVGAKGDELAAFRAQSLKDWETILLHRAAELRPGGWLVLANFCIDEQGRYLGHTGGLVGAAAFARLWRELPGYRWAGLLTGLPGISLLIDALCRIHLAAAPAHRDLGCAAPGARHA